MKKFLLLISILFTSFLLVSNKTYAQEQKYPNYLVKVPYSQGAILFIQENTYTYEFYVFYRIDGVCIETISQNEYFLVDDISINFRKIVNRNTNSYELVDNSCVTVANYMTISLRVTITKTLADDYGYPDYSMLELLFSRDTSLYIILPTDNPIYDAGYQDGYQNGYQNGYENGIDTGYEIGFGDGFTNGYNQGYEDGQEVGYQDGYDDGFSHDTRIKIVLGEFDDSITNQTETLMNVYRFRLDNFKIKYDLAIVQSNIVVRGFTYTSWSADERGVHYNNTDNHLYLKIEKPLIEFIMNRDSVDVITAFRTYLQENNIYGYFERADGKTKYQLGYEDGYAEGDNYGCQRCRQFGRDEGYRDGYTKGYTEGSQESFLANLDKWIVPAIIIVFIVGIFVAYRKGRE